MSLRSSARLCRRDRWSVLECSGEVLRWWSTCPRLEYRCLISPGSRRCSRSHARPPTATNARISLGGSSSLGSVCGPDKGLLSGQAHQLAKLGVSWLCGVAALTSGRWISIRALGHWPTWYHGIGMEFWPGHRMSLGAPRWQRYCRLGSIGRWATTAGWTQISITQAGRALLATHAFVPNAPWRDGWRGCKISLMLAFHQPAWFVATSPGVFARDACERSAGIVSGRAMPFHAVKHMEAPGLRGGTGGDLIRMLVRGTYNED